MSTVAAPYNPTQRSLRAYWPEFLVAVVTIALYARSFGSRFTLDDPALIVQNPTIHSWSFFPQYFTHHFWQNVQLRAFYYRPLVLLWFRINHALFGLNPAGWHVTTVLCHVAASVLVLRLALRLTGNRVVALLAGLIFALHPVHVETAAWISDGVDALLTIWFIAGILCFIRWRTDGRQWLIASLLCYCGAMLTKEPGIMLPAVAILYTLVCEPARSRADAVRRAVAAISGYIPLALLYLLVRHLVLGGMGSQMQAIPAATLALSLPAVLWAYARLLLGPFRLSPFYEFPLVSPADWTHVLLPVFALIALAGVVWLIIRNLRENRRAALFAVGWFGLTIAPVLNLAAFSPGEMVHDRYVYLASVGFCLLLAIALEDIAGRREHGVPVLAAILLATFAGITLIQQGYWRDDRQMFARAVEIAPHNYNAEGGLATQVALLHNYPLAISLYSDILKHDPQHLVANLNLGWIYLKMGDYDQAEHYLTTAALANTESREAFFDLGTLYQKTGRLNLAMAAFTRAQSLGPPHPILQEQIGLILEQEGDWQGALQHMEAAHQLAPDNREINDHLSELQSRPAAP